MVVGLVNIHIHQTIKILSVRKVGEIPVPKKVGDKK